MTNSRVLTDESPGMYELLSEMLEPGGPMFELARRAHHAHLSWNDFLSLRLPQEMSPKQTWEILQLVNRSGGVDLPIPDLDDNDYWYMRTDELVALVCRLSSDCRGGSQLHRRLETALNRRVLVRSRISETISAALLDGLAISASEASDLLRLERTPKNATEQLVLNSLTAVDALEGLVDMPFSPSLFEHLRELLLRNVDQSELHHGTPRMGLLTFDYPDEKVTRFSARQLAYICDYANHVSGDPHDHPVLRALLLPDVFRVYRPLRNLNSQVGRLAFRLYTLKHDLPVLGMLPMSRMKLHWEDGTLPIEPLREEYVTMSPDNPEAANKLTAYETLVARMAATALGGLRDSLDELQSSDDQLRAMLQHRPEINHRQRSILGRALRNPRSQFRIAYHKTTHNVVYATARADLLELVDMGYLEMRKHDRAFIFVPHPELKERLGVSGDVPFAKGAADK